MTHCIGRTALSQSLAIKLRNDVSAARRFGHLVNGMQSCHGVFCLWVACHRFGVDGLDFGLGLFVPTFGFVQDLGGVRGAWIARRGNLLERTTMLIRRQRCRKKARRRSGFPVMHAFVHSLVVAALHASFPADFEHASGVFATNAVATMNLPVLHQLQSFHLRLLLCGLLLQVLITDVLRRTLLRGCLGSLFHVFGLFTPVTPAAPSPPPTPV